VSELALEKPQLLFSNEIDDIQKKMDERATKLADESVLRGIEQRLSRFASRLEDTFWACMFVQEILEGSKDLQKKAAKVKKLIAGLKNYLSSHFGDLKKPAFSSIQLSTLDEHLENALASLKRLDEEIIGALSDRRTCVEERCLTLWDFEELLTKRETSLLDNIENFLPGRFSDIKRIANFTGKERGNLLKKKKEWKELQQGLKLLESKLNDEALETQFGIAKDSVRILKMLIKGGSVQLKDIPEQALLALKKSRKLERKIEVKYRVEKRG